MNSVVIVGRLARDPSVKELTNTTVCNLTVAVQREYSKEKEADFLPVKVFGKQAENCGTYLSKGSQVCVKGRIETGSYSKSDGTKVYTTDIVAEKVEFIGSKNSSENGNHSRTGDEYEGFHAYSDDDEIPF